MDKNVEKRRDKASKLILKQIKKTYKYDMKLALMENVKLKKLRLIVNNSVKLKIDERISTNNLIINHKNNKSLDYILINIINKISPVLYQNIPNDVLDLYSNALNCYFNNDSERLFSIFNNLSTLPNNYILNDLNDVIKSLKYELKNKNNITYYHIKKKLINKRLNMLLEDF